METPTAERKGVTRISNLNEEEVEQKKRRRDGLMSNSSSSSHLVSSGKEKLNCQAPLPLSLQPPDIEEPFKYLCEPEEETKGHKQKIFRISSRRGGHMGHRGPIRPTRRRNKKKRKFHELK